MRRVQFLGREDPLEKGMTTASVFLPGESHEQRSLEGYSQEGHKVSETTSWNTYWLEVICSSYTLNRNVIIRMLLTASKQNPHLSYTIKAMHWLM